MQDIIEPFKKHAPKLSNHVIASISQAVADLGFCRLAAEPWVMAKDIPIEYAIMEKGKNLSVAPYSGSWSDLGWWLTVHELLTGDVATSGNVSAIAFKNSLLRFEHEDMELIGLGVKNQIAIVITMQDAVLVTDMSRVKVLGTQ